MKLSALKILLLISLLQAAMQTARSTLRPAVVGAARADDIRFGKPGAVDLRISANVFYGDEDEERIPVEAEIHLLPASVARILKEKRFAPVDEASGAAVMDDESYLNAIAEVFSRAKDDLDEEENTLLRFLIRDALKAKRIAEIRTDADGRGRARVKSGWFHLFAVHQTRDQVFVWDLPVDLYAGTVEIALDQHNAAAVVDVQ